MSVPAAKLHLEGSSGSEVLRTSDCLAVADQIIRFENHYFGTDFSWGREQMEPWLRSGSLFYAAIMEDGQIVALASMLLTSQSSVDQMVAGNITEQQLSPWFLEDGGAKPVLYFASVISDSTIHLLGLYGSLLLDIAGYLQSKALRVSAGYSIAFGPVGERHLSRNGFEFMQAAPYASKYPFMRVDALTARTEFWQRLLSPPTLPLDEAKAVEFRLRASKAERYRNLCESLSQNPKENTP